MFKKKPPETRQNRPSVEESGQPKKPSLLSDLLFLVLKLAVIVLFFVIIFTFFFGVARVEGDAMSPSLHDGDLLIYYRLARDYNAEDLVMVTKNGKTAARRVVAKTGDTVDINRENGLTINGYPQQEDNVKGETLPVVGGTTFPVTIGDAKLFVLGDNREYAVDSRTYGLVNTADTEGKVIAVIRRRDL